MEEKSTKKETNYIKILNKGKVLEFKYNNQSGFDESEIIIQNISEENIISKVYINNYKNYKCIPNIIITSKNSTSKIKVIMENKDYVISNSDVFLIISHPVDNSLKESDQKNLNEFFKKSEFKAGGQKIFLIGYKESDIKKEKKEDELIKKIKELEKEVFEGMDEAKEQKEEEDINQINNNEINNRKSSSSTFVYLIVFSILVFIVNMILAKFLKK